ncbi:MAG: ABC transporter substrate-binding protein [Chloroflexi bacterium]|nr:ABC transporter substrate-binding protein [Chloroflexota bacterium]
MKLGERKPSAIAGMVLAVLLVAAACGPAATPAPTATPQPTPTSAPRATTTPTRAAPTATPAPSPTPSAAAPKTGGKLRVQTVEGATLDPHAVSFRGSDVFHMFDPLLRLNYLGQLDLGLAESWSAPDPTTLVFKLRKGVQFQDGSPFNAQVAKWNFDRIANPETVAPSARGYIVNVDKVEVVDDYTLRLRLKKPDSALLFYLGVQQLSMMTPTAVAKWGKDVGAHPVGTGPYIFQEWVSASKLRMTRNTSYWDSPRPYVQDLEWVYAEDNTVILASLLTGALDTAQVALPAHLDRLEKTPGMRLYPLPAERPWHIGLNHRKPPLDNLDFRQALNLAVDREGLVKAMLGGRGSPANSILGPSLPEYNKDLPVTKRDIAKAKELVAKSGYKGELLDFACYPATLHPIQCEAVQAQFKEIGVNIQITMYPASAAYSKALGQVLYDISSLMASTIPLDLRIQNYLYSKGRLNSGRFGDTPAARKVDQLVEEISSTYERDARKPLFDELQKVVFDNVLDIYTVNWDSYMVARERVQNYHAYPGGEWLAEVWLKD